MKFHRIFFALVAIFLAGCGALDATPAVPAAIPITVAELVGTPVANSAPASAVAVPTPDDLLSVRVPDYPSPVLPYPSYYYISSKVDKDARLTLVVALHGMYGEGKGFAGGLIAAAERNQWVLAGPTIKYGDWNDPEAVAAEETIVLQRLRATILNMPSLTGRKLKPRVKLFGFSRGAQLAHRYAIAYPEDVSSVVAYSAGTYTLPLASADIDADGRPTPLAFPYGIADLGARIGHAIDRAQMQQVRFLVGVGSNDNRPGDVPRQWDSYVGKTRLERARQFSSVLQKSGTSCTLKVFPGADHEVTRDMLTLAETFLAGDDATPSAILP